ncbi:MAG: phage tail protein [Lysobacteraceae bacterium]|nr:MAG: phage tail protein [Xanthomonadaceae bacterium]
MSEPFLGEIQMVGFNFAPRGWAFCHGSLLSIAQNDALYALLGTTYGGDGQVTFALPDLRGRIPIAQGQGPGLTNRVVGQLGGTETVTLGAQQMPAHQHQMAVAAIGTRTPAPGGNLLASGEADIYSRNAGPTVGLAATQLSAAGSSLPHENMQPVLAVNFIIALEGIFPSRN